MEGTESRQVHPSAVPALQEIVGKNTISFDETTALEDTFQFWQSPATMSAENPPHSEDEESVLTDEGSINTGDMAEELMRVSSREFRFYQELERQRFKQALAAEAQFAPQLPQLQTLKLLADPHSSFLEGGQRFRKEIEPDSPFFEEGQRFPDPHFYEEGFKAIEPDSHFYEEDQSFPDPHFYEEGQTSFYEEDQLSFADFDPDTHFYEESQTSSEDIEPDLHFSEKGQRFNEIATESVTDATTHFTSLYTSQEPVLKPVEPDSHSSYLSFRGLDADIDAPDDEIDAPDDERDSDVYTLGSLGDSCERIATLSADNDIVVLTDIECEQEISTASLGSNTKISQSTGSSESTLPTREPPSDHPARTCKAPKARRRKTDTDIKSITGVNSFTTASSTSSLATSSSETSAETPSSRTVHTKITIRRKEKRRGSPSKSSSRRSSRSEKSGSSPSKSSSGKSRRSGRSEKSGSSPSKSRSGRSARSCRSRSHKSHCKSSHKTSSQRTNKNPSHRIDRSSKVQQQANPPKGTLAKQSPRKMRSDTSCLSVADESLQTTIATRWYRHCENLWAPVFFDLWDNLDDTCDAKVEDEGTLATIDDEMSYEDEGNVNVLVAVQATVLGTDYPEILNAPKTGMPHVWGCNLVGVVQPPKGDTVCSRRFPPGCRVASISAWQAATHKPYIICNSSNLLPVPPLDGLQLDGAEVSILVAAYLPAFQALHHGQRQNRHLAYEPTAFEGQRILILAHKSSSHASGLNQSLVDARVQAAVRMALWAGARDVHVTVAKVGNTQRNIFGNDYRVRLLDTPPEDWVPILKGRMNLVLDFTGGFSFGNHSTSSIAEQVMANKHGRYVGCLGEDCSSPALDCRDESRQVNKKDKSTWSEGMSLLQGKKGCASPGILPEGKDIRHVMEWTALCMNMPRASLFDFYGSWKHDRLVVEHDFAFLLDLLAKRQIRPHVAKILDVDEFPSATKSPQPLRSTRSMSGGVVCEPWSQCKDLDDLSDIS